MTIVDRADFPLVPETEIPPRHEAFRRLLGESDVALAVVTHPVDVFYLTGSMPDGWLLFPRDAKPTLLVRKSLERARRETSHTTVDPFRGARGLAALIREHVGAGEMRLGLDLDVCPAALHLKLAELLPGTAWIDTGSLIRRVRAVKSAWEIEQHKQAARQHVATFAAIREHLAEGVTELELSTAAEAAMRREGHQGLVRFRRPGMELWFCIVGTGPGAAYPTAFDGPMGSDGLHPASGLVAGHRPIRRHVPVMADILGNHYGYHADIARTFCLGEPPDAVHRAHDFCREALRRVEKLLVPGTPWSDVYVAVDDWARQTGEPEGFMGYGENRVKFFGHGVGLEVDEFPVLAKGFRQPLEAGMVVAVEPKAYSPDLGPAGLEMSYVITDQGPVPLLDYPEEIIVVD